jgi:hypothetical protein
MNPPDDTLPAELLWSGTGSLWAFLALHRDARFHAAANRPPERDRESKFDIKGFEIKRPKRYREPARRQHERN